MQRVPGIGKGKPILELLGSGMTPNPGQQKRELVVLVGLPVSGSFPGNVNPFENSFLCFFKHSRIFRHIFSILTQITMDSRVPKDEEVSVLE
jgi:hypothetical protein